LTGQFTSKCAIKLPVEMPKMTKMMINYLTRMMMRSLRRTRKRRPVLLMKVVLGQKKRRRRERIPILK
jgi:hypothetical protein